MINKKNRLFTFFFSLIPGAGEMYLGFLKQGISIMCMFALLLAVGEIIFPPLSVFGTVIWFYSFFHTHNLNSLPDDEFYAIQDEYIIHFSQITKGKEVLLSRYRKLFAFILIFLGASIIWRNINDFLMYIVYDVLSLPDELLDVFQWFIQSLPQMVIALLIIAIGFYLIRNKKKELLELEDKPITGKP